MKKWKCYRKTDQHKIESIFDEKGLKVCDIHYYLNKESESNAKLISCAPEMLEMISLLIERFEENDLSELHAVKRAKELIEKATTI